MPYIGRNPDRSNFSDLNGDKLIIDADADTSIHASTDDQIDIKIGGTDRSTIKATGFHNLDSIKFVAGTSDDMQIYHDGSNSAIAETGTGKLYISGELVLPLTCGVNGTSSAPFSIRSLAVSL